MQITKNAVDRLIADGRPGDTIWDDGVRGFGVRKNRTSAPSYFIMFRLGGRRAAARKFTIGAHGVWPPHLAREEAKRLLRLVDQGIDPRPVEPEPEEPPLTVSDAAANFVRLYLKTAWRASWPEAERTFANIVNPSIGERPVAEIGRRDINRILDPFADRPGRLKLIHSTLRKFFRWLAERGDIDVSPIAGTTPPKAVAARDRVLTPNEFWYMWRASAGMDYPFRQFFQLAATTGQRKSEVAGIRRTELVDLDGERPAWLIPSGRMKAGEAHLLPLGPVSLAIIEQVMDETETPLLLTTTGHSPPGAFSKAKTRLDAEIQKLRAAAGAEQPEDWRIHDLRRTMATCLQACGVPVTVTEKLLAHRSGSTAGIVGVYQRHAYRDEQVGAVAAWNRCLQHLIAMETAPDGNASWHSIWVAAQDDQEKSRNPIAPMAGVRWVRPTARRQRRRAA